MEFESMDNCFPPAQDHSATTFSGRSTRGLMAPTKSNGEPCGSSRRSIVTASPAGTTAPFQIPRFGTISARCGHSLRQFLSSRLTLPVVAASTAAIAWNGHLAAIPFSLVAPLLVYHTKSRKHAYASMFRYYAAASSPLIPVPPPLFPVHATAGPCRMGSRQHKLWGHRTGGTRLDDRIQHGPNHADNDSRVACDRAPLPGTSAHALE